MTTITRTTTSRMTTISTIGSHSRLEPGSAKKNETKTELPTKVSEFITLSLEKFKVFRVLQRCNTSGPPVSTNTTLQYTILHYGNLCDNKLNIIFLHGFLCNIEHFNSIHDLKKVIKDQICQYFNNYPKTHSFGSKLSIYCMFPVSFCRSNLMLYWSSIIS